MKSKKAHKMGITIGIILPALICILFRNETATATATMLGTATNLWWLWEF